jgi:hypothetical protein
VRAARIVRRVVKILAGLILLPVGAIGILLGAMWLDHRSATVLPFPTGPYAVGRTTFDLVDRAHSDPLAPHPGTPRELVAWMWYPAAGISALSTDYLPHNWRAAIGKYRGTLFNSFLNRDLSRVLARSSADTAISSAEPTFPVVLMRPGGSSLTAEYAVLAEDLASHGYVVVGFDAPFRTQVVALQDGRVIARTPKLSAIYPEAHKGDWTW